MKHSPLFNWVPGILDGLKEENMNLEKEQEGKSYERRLTMISDERQRSMV